MHRSDSGSIIAGPHGTPIQTRGKVTIRYANILNDVTSPAAHATDQGNRPSRFSNRDGGTFSRQEDSRSRDPRRGRCSRSRSRSSDWRTAHSAMGCQIPLDGTVISFMLLSIYNNTFDRSNPLNHIVSCIPVLNTTNATCPRRVRQNDGSFFFGGQLKCADLRCGRKTSGSLQSITAGYAFDVENLENLPRRVM